MLQISAIPADGEQQSLMVKSKQFFMSLFLRLTLFLFTLALKTQPRNHQIATDDWKRTHFN